MPDEHEHLRQADRHISESERRVTEQEMRVQVQASAGLDTSESRRLLANFQANLEELYIHRRMILDEIAKRDIG